MNEPHRMSAVARVEAAYARIEAVDRPELWITLRDRDEALAAAAEVDALVAGGTVLPLAGTVLAVKDNIDVAGLPTTAACPEFAYQPAATAPAVERLTAVGAVVLGKTNLDQFATGLVGTRSPYGAVRNAIDPRLVSGGSSSGSAVAVALGIVDLALGTDTAGSGRVPAALNGIVGIKPSLGVVPTTGVVPACIDYDAVTVFARTLEEATAAIGFMIGPDPADARSRALPSDIPLAARAEARLGIPAPAALQSLSEPYRLAWATTLETARAAGIELVEVDIEPLLAAAKLLYDGAVVAERFSAVGEFVTADPSRAGLDPTVAAIISAAARPTASALVDDLDTLSRTKVFARHLLADLDGLLLPTTTEHPSLDAVAAEPLAINRRMGTYTNFCNLLDLSAVAVPGMPTPAGLPFGVMVIEPAFADQIGLDVAARLSAAFGAPATAPALPEGVTGALSVAVFGAHLRGQPLHSELEALGARFVESVTTADTYRLFALETTPPKPGLVRFGAGEGAGIRGERYAISAAGLGRFLAALPAPMGLGAIELDDGRWCTGFTVGADALAGAKDITEFGDWLSYRASLR